MSNEKQNAPPAANMTAAQAIVAVMREIDAVAKGRNNSAQGYKFRGVDDIYNELHPVMAKHGLFTVPRVLRHTAEEKVSKSGSVQIWRVMEIEFDFVSESGDKITVGPFIGEGMDSGDKAANKAHAVAHKYAFLQVFAIPTEDDKDPENTSHDLQPKAREEIAAILADIYAAGKSLPEASQARIKADVEAAGSNLDDLAGILAAVRESVVRRDLEAKALSVAPEAEREALRKWLSGKDGVKPPLQKIRDVIAKKKPLHQPGEGANTPSQEESEGVA